MCRGRGSEERRKRVGGRGGREDVETCSDIMGGKGGEGGWG